MAQQKRRRHSPHDDHRNVTLQIGAGERQNRGSSDLVLRGSAGHTSIDRRENAVGFGGPGVHIWEDSLFHLQRSAKSLEDFAGIRDRLLDKSDKLSIRCNTLLEVAKAHFPQVTKIKDRSWNALRKIVAQQSEDEGETPYEKSRKRDLATVRALWGSDVVEFYSMAQWNAAVLLRTRQCATMCPNFANFVPKVNAALLNRQQKAVRSARYDRLSIEDRLTTSDIKAALKMLKGQNAELADVEADKSPWTSSSLGDFPVGSKLLREWMPHVQPWLLTTDDFGVLSPRSSVSPAGGSASTSPSRQKRPRCGELPENVRGRLLPDSDHETTTHSNGSLVRHPSGPASPSPDAAMSQVGETNSIESRKLASDGTGRADPTSGGKSQVDTYEAGALDTDGCDNDSRLIAGWLQSSAQARPRQAASASQHEKAMLLTSSNGTTSAPEKEAHDESPTVQCSLHRSQAPDTVPAKNAAPTPTSPGLTISDDPAEDHACDIEASLHQRYGEEILDYCRTLHHQSTKSPEHAMRAQWLTSGTRYARIWHSKVLGNCDVEKSTANVLYYTSTELIEVLRTGAHLDRPIVVKESFADRGFHSVDYFRKMLLDCFRGQTLAIRELGENNTQTITVPELLEASEITSTAKAYRDLTLGDLARAQRPLFTLVDRFRLLDKVVENARGHAPNKAVAIDVERYASCNILSLAGAFSGADQAALAGTWVRCLDGLKLCMIVPSEELDDAFYSAGHRWSPAGKERLIVLEPDDVLLMPPGLPVVYAFHSPRPSLMCRGMLWDDLSVLKTLRQLYRVSQRQQRTNKAVGYQLLKVLASLEKLVNADPARYRGPEFQSNEAFLVDFDKSLRRVR